MVCPFCLHKKTSVYNSRHTLRANVIWRRRRCLACNKEFTSHEYADVASTTQVIGAAGTTTPFVRSRLLLSLARACDHRNDDAAYWLAETAQQRLIQLSAAQSGRVGTEDIVKACLAILQAFDALAFVKYLSYNHQGLDSSALRKKLKKR